MTTTDADDHDARLVALLDGALPETEARALREEVADDPAMAARLAALDVDLDGLRDTMAGIIASAPPPPGLPANRATRPMQFVVAACAIMAVMFVISLALPRGASPNADWRDFAAGYHLLYRAETLAMPRLGDGGVAVVSDALGRDLTALSDVAGLEFRRAQILGWENQTLIQFAYLDPQGHPVAVCVMLGATPQRLREADRQGLSTASFSADGLEVLVIGAQGMDGIREIAQNIATLL
ncbi:hypothetical protein V8J82_04355 [Gymnodinialimonas sp. 2305UL16-5]|uniref:anti-sigma factor family protein n=1 Tax=Gymnodinialimonas mytili TaxID=3126503 RepID=UPI0030982034